MNLKQLASRTITGATNKTDRHYSNATTADIQKVVEFALQEAAPYTKKFASELYQLKQGNIFECAKAVWHLLHDDLRYRPDGFRQNIKSPAQLIKDGTGDCKSYSVFISSVLQNLSVPHVIRYAAYDKGDVTHVYIVAYPGTSNQIIIDAVHTRFNEEVAYTYKQDKQVTKLGRISSLPPKQEPRRPTYKDLFLALTTAYIIWQIALK